MKKVNFIEIENDSHFEYHLPCGDGLLDTSLFYKEFKLKKEPLTLWYQYLWDSGITCLATNENSLLYAIIIKFLSSQDPVAMVSFGDSENLKPFESNKVKWKNTIEFTVDDTQLCRQYGYQTPAEFLNEMNYSNKNLTNREFNISRIKKGHLDSYIKTYNSDVTSWTFFVNSDWNGITNLLQNTDKRPITDELLKFSDYVVNIQIGEDEGYLDYVLIQSKRRLKEEILLLQKTVFQFGYAFENLIMDLGAIDEEWKINSFKERFNKINPYNG